MGRRKKKSSRSLPPAVADALDDWALLEEAALAAEAERRGGAAAIPGCSQPVALRRDEDGGRSIVATSRMKAGQLALVAAPYAAVVNDELRGAICDACFKPLVPADGSPAAVLPVQCSGCKETYFCSRTCANALGAVHAQECAALPGLLARMEGGSSSTAIRLVLRICAQRVHDAALAERRSKQARRKKKKKAAAEEGKGDEPSVPSPRQSTYEHVLSLMSHVDKQKAELLLQMHSVLSTLYDVVDVEGLLPERDELLQLFFAVQCNAHAVTNAMQQPQGLALYPLASMLNHACDGNTAHTFWLGSAAPGDIPAPAIRFHALRDIEEGEQVTYSYIDSYLPTSARRAQLSSAYFFHCTCSRCGDGDEDSWGATARTDAALAGPSCGTPDCTGSCQRSSEEGSGDEWTCAVTGAVRVVSDSALIAAEQAVLRQLETLPALLAAAQAVEDASLRVEQLARLAASLEATAARTNEETNVLHVHHSVLLQLDSHRATVLRLLQKEAPCAAHAARHAAVLVSLLTRMRLVSSDSHPFIATHMFMLAGALMELADKRTGAAELQVRTFAVSQTVLRCAIKLYGSAFGRAHERTLAIADMLRTVNKQLRGVCEARGLDAALADIKEESVDACLAMAGELAAAVRADDSAASEDVVVALADSVSTPLAPSSASGIEELDEKKEEDDEEDDDDGDDAAMGTLD